MDLDIAKMDGYEFETFVANLLRKMGFSVEETPLSGDSGIDLIAYSNETLFKGKYLIQCKHWEGNIGEPVVRDLYGVVLSNNANKGILITNSFFTQQARSFARDKNIELVDGDVLYELIHKYYDVSNTSVKGSTAITKVHFTKIKEFEIDKYKYLKHLVDTNKRSLDVYLDLFNFLYSHIDNKGIKMMYAGLIEECLSLTEEIIKRFGQKGKKGQAVSNVFLAIKALLLILLGQIAGSFETLQISKKMSFNLKNFSYNLINFYLYFHPMHYQIDGFSNKEQYIEQVRDQGLITCKANLLMTLIYIDDSYSSKWLYNNFVDYYEGVKTKSYAEVDDFGRKQILDEIAGKNYSLAMDKIQSAMLKKELKLFIPIKFNFNKDNAYLSYSIDKFIDINDISSYWSSELDFNVQKEKIKFLISLNA